MTSNRNLTVTEESDICYVHICPTYVGQFIPLGKLGTQRAFSDKFTPDIDGYTDEPVVLCHVRVAKITFIDDFK